MIIDIHTHLNNYDPEDCPPLEQRVERLEQSMQDNDVDFALVLSSYEVNANRPSTRELVDALQDKDHFAVAAGISFLNYRERDLREISDYLRAGQVKALKLYPGYEPFYPYDRRCQVIYDLAMEFDVPVMIHTGDTYTPRAKLRYTHPLNVDDVAVDNPGLKLVICHLGNPWFRDCMEVVYKNSNVWADISGLVLGDFTDQFERFMLAQVREMIVYAGEPRYLLYGTDWPICRMRSYLKFIDGLALSDEHKEMILWKNAVDLYRLPVKPRVG
jgi:uncharacterized protein